MIMNMKKEWHISIPVLCGLLALMLIPLFISCTESDVWEQEADRIALQDQSHSGDSDFSEDGISKQLADGAASRSNRSSGVIYTTQAGLYIQNDEGKMKWQAEASLGDTALYLGTKKEAVRTDGQKRTFFHIELHEKEYWIQDYCYEPNTVLGFISAANTVLYKSNILTGATDEIIPQFFIVAVDRESIEQTDKFVKIAAYCPELSSAWVVKNKYVKRDNIELDPVSVDAMLLAYIASESRNDTIRAELYQNAIELNSPYTDTIAVLQNLTEVIIAEEAYLKTLTIEKVNETLQPLVEARLVSIPGTADARILHTIAAGTVVTASKKTVAGESGTWYFVQNKQKKGWVHQSCFTLIE